MTTKAQNRELMGYLPPYLTHHYSNKGFQILSPTGKLLPVKLIYNNFIVSSTYRNGYMRRNADGTTRYDTIGLWYKYNILSEVVTEYVTKSRVISKIPDEALAWLNIPADYYTEFKTITKNAGSITYKECLIIKSVDYKPRHTTAKTLTPELKLEDYHPSFIRLFP